MAKKDMAAEIIRLHDLGATAEAIAKHLSLDRAMVEWVLNMTLGEV